MKYIQYHVIKSNRKENEKEHICINESLCCTVEINIIKSMNKKHKNVKKKKKGNNRLPG